MAVGDRTKRSVDALRELYSVVVAFALVGAIGGLVSKNASGIVFFPENIPWFIALFTTLLPFYHGALAYLDKTYIFSTEQPKRLALLVDYLILLCEAGLFVWLGLIISDTEGFVEYYAYLLILDVFWAAAVYFLTPAGLQTVWRWLVINLVTLGLMAAISYTPFLQVLKPDVFAYLAILRSIADYIWCWGDYFPES